MARSGPEPSLLRDSIRSNRQEAGAVKTGSTSVDRAKAAAAPSPASPTTSDELLHRLRVTLQMPVRAASPAVAKPAPPAPPRASRKGVVPNSWLDQLLRQYGSAAPPPPPRARLHLTHGVLLGTVTAAALAGGLYWRELRAAYAASYPAEPMKREALRACSMESPTFIRFLPEERAACYERMTARLAGSEGADAGDTGAAPR